jgi:sulfite reductase (NADPH) flavoprotein alpha-component
VNYKPGHILRVKPRNSSINIESFLKSMNWNGDDLVVFGENNRVLTIREHASSMLELFACPKSSFLKRLADLVTSSARQRQLVFLANNTDMVRDQGLTYASVLIASKLNNIMDYGELVDSGLVPEIAERSYSIASCKDVVGSRQVDLIVVRETWNTIEDEHRAGLCSSFLCDVPRDTIVEASIDTSTSLDLTDPSKDIVMIGFGTGIAPLRAFCQWYYHLRRNGKHTGEIILYFGARTSSNENMYGFELSSMLRGMMMNTTTTNTQSGSSGPIRMLRQAFSRDDPKKKVYVQHLMKEDRDVIREFLVARKGVLMLCGPTRPVDSACDVVGQVTGISTEALAAEGRLLVESY